MSIAKDRYEVQQRQWLDAVQERRDAQEILNRKIAREHELAERLIEAAKRL